MPFMLLTEAWYTVEKYLPTLPLKKGFSKNLDFYGLILKTESFFTFLKDHALHVIIFTLQLTVSCDAVPAPVPTDKFKTYRH
jgi:hypothetical protein